MQSPVTTHDIVLDLLVVDLLLYELFLNLFVGTVGQAQQKLQPQVLGVVQVEAGRVAAREGIRGV